jgi:hypothetical protein
VRGCQGAKQSGDDCLLADLPGRGRKEVSATFDASGTGEVRIYAVLDPENALKNEVHEDNNKAYGPLQIAAAEYAESGRLWADAVMGAESSYRRLVYTDTVGNPTMAAVPLRALDQTTRVELRPWATPAMVAAGWIGTGHAFEITAFNGEAGSNWTDPVELTFGGSVPPALVEVRYADTDVPPQVEAWLRVMRWTAEDGWQDAVCPGMQGEVIRQPGENSLLTPVCGTGKFALMQPGDPLGVLYLPLVGRGTPK